MPGTTIPITIEGEDRASGVFGAIAASLGNIGEIAAGIGLARLFEAGLSAAKAFGEAAFDYTSNLIASEAAIRALAASQEQLNSQQWDNVVVGYTTLGLTEKEQKELKKLTKDIERHRTSLALDNAQIREQTQRVWEMTNRWTEQGLATETAKARLADMSVARDQLAEKLAEEEARLAELTAKQNQSVAITKRVFGGQMEWGEAVEVSTERANELLQQIRRMAVQRGMPYEAVATMYQFAMAVGMNKEQMDSLLPGLVDFTRVIGASPERARDAAKAIADIGARGKLTGEEVRQLGNASIPVMSILSKVTGQSREELVKLMMKGAIPAEDVFSALSNYFSGFAEAADQVSETLPGATAGLKEAVKLSIAYYFRDVGNELGKVIDGLRDMIGSEDTLAAIAEAGKNLAQKFSDIKDKASDLYYFIKDNLIPIFKQEGLAGAVALIMEKLGLSEETVTKIIIVFGLLGKTLDDLKTYFLTLIDPVKNLNLALGEKPTAGGFLDWLIKNWPLIDLIIRGILFFLVGRFAAGAVVKILSVVVSLIGLIISSFPAFLGFVAIVGLLIFVLKDGLVGAVTTAIAYFKTFWEFMSLGFQKWGQVFSMWGEAIGMAFDAVRRKSSGLAKMFIGLVKILSGFRTALMVSPAAAMAEITAGKEEMQAGMLMFAHAGENIADVWKKNQGQLDETQKKIDQLWSDMISGSVKVQGLPSELGWLTEWDKQIKNVTKDVEDMIKRINEARGVTAEGLPSWQYPGFGGAPGGPLEVPIEPNPGRGVPGAASGASVQNITVNVGTGVDPTMVRRASYQGVYTALREMGMAF